MAKKRKKKPGKSVKATLGRANGISNGGAVIVKGGKPYKNLVKGK